MRFFPILLHHLREQKIARVAAALQTGVNVAQDVIEGKDAESTVAHKCTPNSKRHSQF